MILLPFEVLTLTGFKEAIQLNTIFDKVCTYNYYSQTLHFQLPASMYTMPLFFQCYHFKTPTKEVIIDEAQYNLNKHFDTQNFKIEKRSGSSDKWNDDNFLLYASYQQCMDCIYELFDLKKDLYCPLLEGSRSCKSFEEASKIQIIALFAGQNLTIHCTFATVECVLNEIEEDAEVIKMPMNPEMYGVNLTLHGGIVVRTCKSISCFETVYSLFIV